MKRAGAGGGLSSEQSGRVVIIAGGDLKDPAFYRGLLKAGDYIIAVNGGAAHARRLGQKPDLLLGDFDSLPPGEQSAGGVPDLLRYPSAKEKSDLELALDRAVDMDPPAILICGALGGSRADHAFINLLLLQVPMRQGIPATIVDERHEICLVERETKFAGCVGDYLSLFSLTAETSGIVTCGLKYPLKGESLYFSSTRGLSNELISPLANVSIKAGLLLAIRISAPLP